MDNDDIYIELASQFDKSLTRSPDSTYNSVSIELNDENKTNIIRKFFNFVKEKKPELLITEEEYSKDFNKAIMLTINIQTVQLLLNAKKLILTGAPGTGKTYLAIEIAKVLTGDTDDNHPHYEMVQFHPSYDYSDFVEGLRPVNNGSTNQIGFERKDGVFKEFCKKALEDYNNYNNENDIKKENAPKFVFIIDEINRGEMSKIFGELFFSIDHGYRGVKGKIKTHYQNLVDKKYDANGNVIVDDLFKDGFFVPENVYIIGTMNDIDRSVESMDFAMRRRFAFKEVKAEDRIGMWNEHNLKEDTVKLANSLMRSINCAIEQIPGLSSAYHVGPSYFLKLKECNAKDLWDNSLKGLLFEYLRGMPDADSLLQNLKNVYDNAIASPFENELSQERADGIINLMKL